ncbi:MAG: ABC transporter ATP-binding protein [Muribaculaceae bacterium]|nr:ABC transporter ATP-binding protein [Muribaculaceae bacterium]
MIQIQEIVKSYDSLRVLNGITLDIRDGEVLSIVGPSGAGKTTLLQIIGSLDRADSGQIIYDGVDLQSLKGKALDLFRNKNIGFVFQFHQLLPEFTLEENVAMPAMIGGKSRKESMGRARELLDYLGLGNRLTHKPNQLSGGERQRAAVARALVNRPKVVLADEPSGSLDTQNRQELHGLFFDLRRDLGQTFVIVTHDTSLATGCDRIVTMRDGTIESITVNDVRK